MQPGKKRARRARFWLNLTKAYVNRYRLRISIISTSIILITWAIFAFYPKVIRNNIVTIGYAGSYTIENIPSDVLSLVTQPLFSEDELGKPIPSLASHWTVSEDGKTYVVFLKDNLRWHDETVVDAKDITIAIENVQIAALNNKAIEFKLPNPIFSFPVALNKPVFKSESFYGTGHYRIVDIDRSNNIIKKISLAPKDESLPRVDLKFYSTEEQLTEAIKLGNVKKASVANAKIFENWPNLNVERAVDEKQIITIFYNTRDSLLALKEFRQGLNYAIDRSSFDGIQANSPYSPSNWAYNDAVKRYDFNTGKAKELLSKSQLENPKITLSVVGGMSEIANSIKNNWEDVGVEVEIKEEKGIPKQFQALLALNEITANPDQYGLWHSTQEQTNLTKLKDPKIDKLLEDGRVEQDEELRKEIYINFQETLVDSAPTAFLYYPFKYNVTFKNAINLISKLPK